MPTLKSAAKRMRSSEKQRQKNVAFRTRIKTARSALFSAVEAKSRDTADKAYRAYCTMLDKASKVGVITKNTAIRRKSRAANQVRAI